MKARKHFSQTVPQSKSTPDFFVENHFSIFLLRPVSPVAQAWVEEHLPEDRQEFGGAVVVEHRYIVDIVEGIQRDGLAVR